jgi:hypothetical protein
LEAPSWLWRERSASSVCDHPSPLALTVTGAFIGEPTL